MRAEPTDDKGGNPFSRRRALRKAGVLGLGVVFAPVLPEHTTLAQSAPTEVLGSLLELEYLERAFYQEGLEAEVIPSEAEEELFQELYDHDAAHVDWLCSSVGEQDGSPAEEPSFDFTAGGQFAPFDDYRQFLLLAQGFKDMTVRAYQGQIPAFLESELLTGVLQIHSVEARHAAAVRRLLAREGVAPGQRGWIEAAGAEAPDVLTDLGIYAGEDDLTVAGDDLGDLDYADVFITAAYDKPMARQEVQEIIQPFIVEAEGRGRL